MAKKEKEYTKEDIKRLEKQIEWLEKENKYLKKLTNSKRFIFAEKIATGYNNVFPKNTKRRGVLEKTGKGIKAIYDIPKRNKFRKKQRTIANMAAQYDKVIVFNAIPWDIKLKQRPQHLAEELRKLGYFIIYFEKDNAINSFREIKDGLITINNLELLDKINTATSKCYFLTPNNMPTEFDTIMAIKKQGFGIIYDYLDEFHEDISGDLSIQLKVWDNLKTIEPVLCCATAKRLITQLENHLGKGQKIISAKNAVNVDHFDYLKNKTKRPPTDIASIVKEEKPIIGFYGALAPWIDFSLINQVAKKHQEWNFVLLGVDYNGAAADLEKGKNVYNLGAKNYSLLPAYARYFNCAIIPFKQGEIAKATSPVKLFEYMAAGLPTVCTRDLNECRGYDYVYMAEDNNDFEKKLKKAIDDYNKEECRKKLLYQAEQNTWTKRAEDIKEALDEIESLEKPSQKKDGKWLKKTSTYGQTKNMQLILKKKFNHPKRILIY